MPPRFRPVLLTCLLLCNGLSHAADKPAEGPVTLRLLCSSGFIGAAQAIAPDYEKGRAIHLEIIQAPPAGLTRADTLEQAPNAEAFDLVLTDRVSMDRLVAQRRVDQTTRTDLGRSFIAMAVKDGAHKPRIDTVDGLRCLLKQSYRHVPVPLALPANGA